MSKGRQRNLAASVRQRLANLARKEGEEFQFVLIRYALERFLYRLGRSEFQGQFILKGAMLFRMWTAQTHRPTHDLDLLAKGDFSSEGLIGMFRALCTLAVEDDGLVFDPQAVRAEQIREDQEYGGIRVHGTARLGQARIDPQVDIGFGDAVTPKAGEVTYPVLLEFPAPRVLAYPQPTVVAEKFQAMVSLGIGNSRMKDFYDLWFLARSFDFSGRDLSRAIQTTFKRRKTALPPEPPLALTDEFGSDAVKVKLWKAFLRKNKLDVADILLEQVCSYLAGFLMPPVKAIVADEAFNKCWPAGGPWADELSV